MKVWNNIVLFFKRITLPLNWIKTIWFNFYMFPFNTAIRLPIHLYGRVQTKGCVRGSIVFADSRKPHFGAWQIGGTADFLRGPSWKFGVTRFIIEGKLILGERGYIASGNMIRVTKGAVLSLGRMVCINYNTKIACTKSISIGEGTGISWETQFFDTNFHYMQAPDKTIKDCRKPIVIGKHNWIGNRSSIYPGTILGDWSIVASHSLVNKDFSSIECGIFAGIPAKLIKHGYKRVFNYATEYELQKFFDTNFDGEFINDDMPLEME